jgi:hypothetical protein
MKATVKILRTDRPTPAGKLADAEIHFAGGELDGLKLIGFAVWERRNGSERVVTFPARPFTIHGERRHFALIRAIDDPNAQDRLRELVLQAYVAEVEPAEKVGTP